MMSSRTLSADLFKPLKTKPFHSFHSVQRLMHIIHGGMLLDFLPSTHLFEKKKTY
ncbi:hypothetical protein Hanom_Chr11g01020661 [Helianthus anomalus]